MESKVELSNSGNNIVSDSELTEARSTPFYKSKVFLMAAGLMVAGGVAAAIAVPLANKSGDDDGSGVSDTSTSTRVDISSYSGSKPPMGWRSWNAFKTDINKDNLRAQVDAIVAPHADGVSLLDLGYNDVGMDDGYQECQGMTKIHDPEGNYVINMTRFPDMLGLTTYAHEKGVTMGFYTNNCWCPETLFNRGANTTYQKDVDYAIANGFAGIKVDGCGPNDQIHQWSEAVQKSTVKNPLTHLDPNAPKLAIENCGNNPNRPKGMPMTWSIPTRADVTGDNCTFDTYRVSKDIAPEFYSAMNNLQHIATFTDPRLGEQLSRPDCWAYGDMLQVGFMNNTDQDKSHFGAWAIASSPLILGYDLSNETVSKKVLPIVSNPLAIRINQAYYGDAGHVAANGTNYIQHYAAHSMDVDPFCAHMQQCTNETFPEYQIWVKSMAADKSKAAILVINMLPEASVVKYNIPAVAELSSGSLFTNDVWAYGNGDSGVAVPAGGDVEVPLDAYASQFIVVSGSQTNDKDLLATL